MNFTLLVATMPARLSCAGKASLLLAFVSLIACFSWSDQAHVFPPVVVTARTWPEAPTYLPASVAVWLPETASWGIADGIADWADETPGVHRTADGPWASDLSIRGMSGDRMVVTLDGARLVTATDLAARLALIDGAAIERVEVFKGPVSALYGSGSLGGIVNVVLARPIYSIDPVWSQRVRLGAMHNPDGWSARYDVSHSAPRQYTAASFAARDADAYRDGDGQRVRNSQFSDQALTLRVGQRWAAAADSDVLVQIHRGSDIGIPGSGRAPLPAQADVTYREARRLLVALNNRLVIDGSRWKTSGLNVYFQQIEREVRIDGFPDGPIRYIAPVGRHDTWGARWLNEFDVGQHRIGAGLDTWRRELDSTRERVLADGRVVTDRPLPEASEWSYGAFVEDRWTLHPAFSVTAGARVDGLHVENRATPEWESDTVNDMNWNAHAGFRWNLTPHWALRSVAAAGYRAPSIEERYQFLALGDGQIKLGNPDLDAERSRFLEMGVEWRGTSWMAELTGFANHLRNRVGEERLDETTLRNASIDRARIHGIEAEARREWADRWDARASLAWLRGDDRSRREPLPDIAPLTGAVGLGYRPVDAVVARLRAVFAARQDRVPAGVEETPGWGRLDLSVAYTMDRGWGTHEIRLAVLNATDTTWRDHLATWRGSPHNEAGRSVQVTWESRF